MQVVNSAHTVTPFLHNGTKSSLAEDIFYSLPLLLNHFQHRREVTLVANYNDTEQHVDF